MKQQTAPGDTQLSADQRIYNLGYSRGYEDGLQDGVQEGEEAMAAWLHEELALLVQDVRLALRHDLATPLDVLAEVTALVEGGKPVGAANDAA